MQTLSRLVLATLARRQDWARQGRQGEGVHTVAFCDATVCTLCGLWRVGGAQSRTACSSTEESEDWKSPAETEKRLAPSVARHGP
jgi:hypothetical protein